MSQDTTGNSATVTTNANNDLLEEMIPLWQQHCVGLLQLTETLVINIAITAGTTLLRSESIFREDITAFGDFFDGSATALINTEPLLSLRATG